jgi:hypothetical protein
MRDEKCQEMCRVANTRNFEPLNRDFSPRKRQSSFDIQYRNADMVSPQEVRIAPSGQE